MISLGTGSVDSGSEVDRWYRWFLISGATTNGEGGVVDVHNLFCFVWAVGTELAYEFGDCSLDP
jgi:hypothetical protein